MPTENSTGRNRRITNAAQLRALKIEDRPYEASDTKREGLRLRVRPTGKRTWWYTYREPGEGGRQGKIHRIRLGEFPKMGLEAARTARDEWAGKRTADGKADPHEVIAEQARKKAEHAARVAAQANRDVWTVQRLADAWIEAIQRTTRERTWKEARRHLDREVIPDLGKFPAEAVTREHIAKALRVIERRGKIRQRNAVRTTLVMLWNWAAAHGPEHLRRIANPAAEVPVLRVKPARARRAFTERELRAIWEQLKREQGDGYADALSLALLCGTRASETVGARWREIDLDAGTWQIPAARTKSSRPHLVYLSTQAIALLKPRQRSRGAVFDSDATASGHVRHDGLAKALRARLESLELDTELTPHELRHTFLTAVVGRFRMPQEVRRRVANHVSGDALERIYVHHSYDEEAREAWAKWGAYLDGLVTGSTVVELRPGVGA